MRNDIDSLQYSQGISNMGNFVNTIWGERAHNVPATFLEKANCYSKELRINIAQQGGYFRVNIPCENRRKNVTRRDIKSVGNISLSSNSRRRVFLGAYDSFTEKGRCRADNNVNLWSVGRFYGEASIVPDPLIELRCELFEMALQVVSWEKSRDEQCELDDKRKERIISNVMKSISSQKDVEENT